MNGYSQARSFNFYRQLRDSLDAIPGVESASLAIMPVLKGYEWDNSMAVEGFANKPAEVPEEVYRPYYQMNFATGMYPYVRTARPPEQIFPAIRQIVNGMDANLPVFDVNTIEKQMKESLITERLVATLSTGFGLLATLLAAIGP